MMLMLIAIDFGELFVKVIKLILGNKLSWEELNLSSNKVLP